LALASTPAQAADEPGAFTATVDGAEEFPAVLFPLPDGIRFAVRLAPVGGDECGREYILDCVLQPNVMRTGGTILGGSTYRCTTEALEKKCKALGRPIGENYFKGVTGTFTSSDTPRGLLLQVNYIAETWVKDDCKFEKQDKGSFVVFIALPRSRGGAAPGRGVFDDLTRSILYNAPGHPLRP
jgi:hypothetical protein